MMAAASHDHWVPNRRMPYLLWESNRKAEGAEGAIMDLATARKRSRGLVMSKGPCQPAPPFGIGSPESLSLRKHSFTGSDQMDNLLKPHN